MKALKNIQEHVQSESNIDDVIINLSPGNAGFELYKPIICHLEKICYRFFVNNNIAIVHRISLVYESRVTMYLKYKHTKIHN